MEQHGAFAKFLEEHVQDNADDDDEFLRSEELLKENADSQKLTDRNASANGSFK